MKFVNTTCIELDRELSDLDRLAVDFTTILHNYTPYVIVSGYVAILLGRSRASEDIDIIIPKIDYATFQTLADELKANGFYCLNTEENKDIYEYLTDNLAVRFARHNTVIPNIEMKWAKNSIDELALKKTLTIKFLKGTLYTSHLELQIAFKEIVLRSPKDMEDARHMRNIAEKYLDKKLIKQYKEMLRDLYR